MSPFASILCLGLVACSAAEDAEKKLVRKTVSVSVSPHGDVSGESEYQPRSRVQNLLEEVEEMSRSGTARGQEDKITFIKNIVVKELIPDLEETKAASVDQIATSLDAIKACNANGVSQQKQIAASTEVSVDGVRKTHTACREEEKKKMETKGSRCQQLDDFLNAINLPATKPNPPTRDAMVEYVESMTEYFCPKGPTTTELDDACKKAEEEHAAHKGDCDRNQAAFESGFCTWRTQTLDTCDQLGQCYRSKTASHAELVSATKKLVAKWKVEYASLKKIVCYTDVWLKDKNVKTVDEDQLNKCQDSKVDTSPMDIEYPKVPPQAECPTTKVDVWPGTADFTKVEYHAFSDFAVDVIPCLAPISANAEQTGGPDVSIQPVKPPGALVTCHLTIDNYLTGVKYNGAAIDVTYTATGQPYAFAHNAETNPHKDHHWVKSKTFTFNDAGAGVNLDISGFEHDRVGSFKGCRNSGLALECTAADPKSPWNLYGSDLSTWKAKGADTPGGLATAEFAKPCETTSGFHLSGAKGYHKEIWAANDLRYAEFSGSPYN